MAVTAAMVKELRERTGAGMMDCKNVLVETDGDMEKAIDLLREKGLAKAAKKAGRIAAQGLVKLSFAEDGKTASVIEVNSETDFVAKNPEFVEFVEKCADIARTSKAQDVEALKALPFGAEGTVGEVLTAKIAKIGENMSIRRFVRFDRPGTVYVGYIHNAGQIGVVAGFETEATLAEIETMGKDVCMQICSMNPKFVDQSSVDPEYLESEKQILIQQALNEGKPANIVEKMVVGRLKKELQEVCLVNQKFVKDNELTIQKYTDKVAKELGGSIKVVDFVRYALGE